jgi:hypothetical protein
MGSGGRAHTTPVSVPNAVVKLIRPKLLNRTSSQSTVRCSRKALSATIVIRFSSVSGSLVDCKECVERNIEFIFVALFIKTSPDKKLDDLLHVFPFFTQLGSVLDKKQDLHDHTWHDLQDKFILFIMPAFRRSCLSCFLSSTEATWAQDFFFLSLRIFYYAKPSL